MTEGEGAKPIPVDVKVNGQTVAKDQDTWLAAWLHQILYVTMRGIFSAVPPTFRIEKIIMVSCMTMARIVAEVYAGEELAVRRMRKSCRDVFDETLKTMPVVPLEQPPVVKTDTAAIGG